MTTRTSSRRKDNDVHVELGYYVDTTGEIYTVHARPYKMHSTPREYVIDLPNGRGLTVVLLGVDYFPQGEEFARALYITARARVVETIQRLQVQVANYDIEIARWTPEKGRDDGTR